MKLLSQRSVLIGFALVTLMSSTRMHHFGSALHLPDASLSVFLLAGFFIASPLLFCALLVVAGMLDYVAIAHLGVSDWCVTPAYWFLIPTYAVLWYAGRYYARSHRHSLRSLGMFAGLSVASLSLAFIISNGAFYLFSGRYAGMGMAEYTSFVAPEYAPYLSGGLLYLGCAAALYAVLAVRAPITAIKAE